MEWSKWYNWRYSQNVNIISVTWKRVEETEVSRPTVLSSKHVGMFLFAFTQRHHFKRCRFPHYNITSALTSDQDTTLCLSLWLYHRMIRQLTRSRNSPSNLRYNALLIICFSLQCLESGKHWLIAVMTLEDDFPDRQKLAWSVHFSARKPAEILLWIAAQAQSNGGQHVGCEWLLLSGRSLDSKQVFLLELHSLFNHVTISRIPVWPNQVTAALLPYFGCCSLRNCSEILDCCNKDLSQISHKHFRC